MFKKVHLKVAIFVFALALSFALAAVAPPTQAACALPCCWKNCDGDFALGYWENNQCNLGIGQCYPGFGQPCRTIAPECP